MALLTLIISILTLIWCISLLLSKFSKKGQPLLLPPGPKGLRLIGSLSFLGPELHSYFTTLAKTYGPIFSFRAGKKIIIVISTPSMAREVLKDKDIIFANRDITIAAKVGFYGGSDILWSPYGNEWRMLRKVFAREMLSGSMVALIYEIHRREVQKMLNHFRLRRMSLVNVGEEIFMTVFNSVTTLLWGDGGNEIAERSLGIDLQGFVEEMTTLIGKPNISDLIPCVACLDLYGVEKKMKRLRKKFDNICELMINERIMEDNENNEKKDFLQALLNSRKGDEKTPLTATHLKSLLLDMIIGATDTTSRTMEFAMAELINNPHVMKKAQQELEVVVGTTNNMVEESHVPKLPYLYAIMKETLRLHPSVPFLATRSPSESSSVGGYTIPMGSTVLINAWAIHRDPSIWEDPLKFHPERFINSKWDYSGNNLNYIPFGSGRRICVGKQFAEKMFIILVGSLLHSFEWKMLNNEKVDLEEKFGFVLKKKEPLMAIPTPKCTC